MIKISPLTILLIVSLVCLIPDLTKGQKLPSLQLNKVKAPNNINIDGNAKEWNDKFQAYNNNTEFFYTISNDDSNIYLILQATKPEIIARIINGGVTFSINKFGEKKASDSFSVTYPTVDERNRVRIDFKKQPLIKEGLESSVIKADSFMTASNIKLNRQYKIIRTNKLKGIDTLISIYNDFGIKAAALFDNKMIYTYELKLPLESLDLSVTTSTKIAYQLMINEVKPKGVSLSNNLDPQQPRTINFSSLQPVIGQYATDFWGYYELAK